jgi:phosphoribosylformylglycinamidine synthase II
VQVGNPFLEKLLMEACQELAHTDWIVGLQDLGAAGLTSASIECAARSGTGIVIDVARVPRRERGMTPYEVMLSESQERMLVVARRGSEEHVIDLFRRWDLETAMIGTVTDDGMVRVTNGGREVAVLPVGLCTDPPLYRRAGVPPAELEALHRFDFAQLPDLDALPALARPGLRPAEAALLDLLAAPNVCSKRWVYRQYDHQVLTNTVEGPGGDAAVLRLKDTGRGIALTLDGNGRLCRLDPFTGGAIAVAEAARNIVCSGAQPLALTNCLNFGNPEKLDVYYQLEQAIRGMSAACEALGTPVISGNVSLYNETAGAAIDPTPVVGMVGLLEQIAWRRGAGFMRPGDVVALLGAVRPPGAAALAGSEVAERLHSVVAGRPALDLDLEVRLQRCCLAAIHAGIIESTHDCSEGGLALALAECCILGGTGLDAASLPSGERLDAALFGEVQSRIVVSVAPDRYADLEAFAARHGVGLLRIGTTGGDRVQLGGLVDLGLDRVRAAYEDAFERLMT